MMRINIGDQFIVCGNKSFHDFTLDSLVEVVEILPNKNHFRLDKRPRYDCKLIKGSFNFFTEYDKDRDNPLSFSQLWEDDMLRPGTCKPIK